jgi:hypothetical protein
VVDPVEPIDRALQHRPILAKASSLRDLSIPEAHSNLITSPLTARLAKYRG